MTVRRPGPIVRRLLRSPALLYDCNVGWLLGHRFLRLTHTGRQSGRHYQTMLEVLGTGPAPREVIVIAGLGRSADWYRNVQALIRQVLSSGCARPTGPRWWMVACVVGGTAASFG